VTEDDAPEQEPMRLPASYIRETLKEVSVDETCMRIGDKGVDLVLQWNVHLDWNALVVNVGRYLRTVLRVCLIPNLRVRISIVSYRS
jgi:hypothetical protein